MVNKNRPINNNGSKNYSDTERQFIRDNLHLTNAELSSMLGRSIHSIKQKKYEEKLKKKYESE
jgi:hypothetical protein